MTTTIDEPDDEQDNDDDELGDPPPPHECYGCKVLVEWADLVPGVCATGDCAVSTCPHCGYDWASIGPVLCKACGGMTFWQRQQHRVEMWIFDYIEMPVRRGWRWLKRAVVRR